MNSTTDNIAEAQDHIASAQALFNAAVDTIPSEQPGTLTQSTHALHMATAHAAVAQAQALERIATALERIAINLTCAERIADALDALTGPISADGEYYDVRTNNY
jgi:hypothetical protein